jgi:hypothetical protein
VEKGRNDGEFEMSKATHAAAKADRWLQEYLAMGDDRSLRKLATEAPRIASARGYSYVPLLRTLGRWSSLHGWDRRARKMTRR